MKYELTTNNPASSYGVPVLIINGVAYGPLDKIPNGELAFYFIEKEDHVLRDKFLKSAPDLYFKINPA